MTARNRWTIVAAVAGAVLVAAIALILANRGGAKADATPGSNAPVASGSAGASSTTTTTAAPAPTITAPAQVTAPSIDPPSAPSVDTVSDTGAAVHDHRADPGAYHDNPTVPRTGPPVHVTNTFAVGVGNLVAPIASACTAQIPSEARGSQPVIQVRMTVTIKNGQLSIDDVATELRDITGDQDAVKDCVKSKASALSIDATGQPDVDHYPITMPMRVAS